jgi:hypothetical protein
MLILPTPPRRASLRAFALALGLMAGLALGCLAALFVSGAWFGVGFSFGLAAAALGALWPHTVASSYVLWNRFSDLYMRIVRLLLKIVCFHFVLAIAPRSDFSLSLARPGSDPSFWIPRKDVTLPPRSTHADGPGVHWKRSYVAWVVRSRKWWALSLLPFLILLAAIDTETGPSVPSGTYTLF